MTSPFRELAKQRPVEVDPMHGLMCTAHGCPMRWTVDPARLCSYHAGEHSKNWPSITEALNRDGPWPLYAPREVDTTSHKGHPKAWALRLKERHELGEHLSPLQVSMYREALRLDTVSEAE